MPAISVVVPVYEVERYVMACLRSIAGQTFGDLEVIVVDDGTTDRSADLARAVAEEDPRFRVIAQDNAGLGAARNTGLAHASADLVMFVDSDDVLPPDALTRLEAALRNSRSDFATGNVHRFDGSASRQAPWVKKAYVRARARTHVTRFPWLISDRTAWNKLWRRDFLERHRLRFAEGMFHEDIPMVIPAHYLARSVDVVKEPVYLWREREGGPLSITQRRLTLRLLEDRVAAVEQVCDFLEQGGFSERDRRIYYESVVTDDLRYHLDVLDEADDEYRRVFLSAANAFLARAGEGIEDRLPAIQRLKWHLVRRRALPELIEVVRFDNAGLRRRRTLRAGRVYGDYPFLDDPGLAIPRSVYRLDETRRRARQAWTLLRPATVPQR
jgi:CDP-glycerol glycerophosphotransferase